MNHNHLLHTQVAQCLVHRRTLPWVRQKVSDAIHEHLSPLAGRTSLYVCDTITIIFTTTGPTSPQQTFMRDLLCA